MAQPLVSVIMPVYQQERFVAEALRSVMRQSYRPLEIIVLDDCSTDRTFEVAAAQIDAYRGPHRVFLHRNERNLGIETYNVLMQKAQGEFIVQAHGDDVSHGDRVERLVERWLQSKASMVSSNVVQVDETGEPMNLWFQPEAALDCSPEALVRRRWHGPCVGAALAYEREVMEAFGPFVQSRSSVNTDGMLPFRASILKGIAVLEQPLVRFRRHAGAASQRNLGTLPFREAWEAEVAIRSVSDLHSISCVKRLRPDDAHLDTLRILVQSEMLRHAVTWARFRTAMRGRGWRLEWTEPADARGAVDDDIPAEAESDAPVS